ncbi:protein kinase domain, Nitrogen network kinase 1, Phloem protein 2-like protein [Artemisia annua]|uniref:Protein kinase domain, Nitrogen network kinase 1, Phloem protein 2-like protein n=1 Tax=Artemisia annua TaxID=35608 RepID=A0A2U1N525_ARTAN|nr:protein kinase domain, Nitrogen network kinase 1, Phloem protein 2-like protein [Artemisia annua]
MASLSKEFEHLEIQLEEIKSATNNFSEENVIGHGGFGKVYKGELSHSNSKGKSMVALKRLDRRHGQGDSEFHKEVRMLSRYRHENIISLVGFSSGRDEMILVYEYASRGSLDRHLTDVTLTWTQRIKGQLKVHVSFWKKCYEEKKLDTIVFQGLMQQMDPDSLVIFADIAYECLKRSHEERPAMSLVVQKLQESLALQQLHDLKPPKEYEEIVNAAVPPLNYRSLDELKVLLTEGFQVNAGKTWLSINEKGERIERIYIQSCNPQPLSRCFQNDLLVHLADDILNSRFPGGRCYLYQREFKARVRGEYLTPHISYTVNLVLRYKKQSEVNSFNPLRYKIDGEDETKVFIIYPSIHEREDGWFIVPLYHFTTQHATADLQFQFEHRGRDLLVAGIEFQPSEEKVQLPVFEEYQHILEAASQSLFYTSLAELKQILSKGIHLKDYKEWFSLNEKGQHSHMISIKDCLIQNEYSTPQTYKSDCDSRFPVGLYQTNNKGFTTHVKTQLLSPSITYTVNLVYNSSSYGEQAYVDLKYRLRGEATTSVVYLANQRQDNWFYMAELYQFTSDGSIVDLEIIFETSGTNIDRVEGIMFQPVEIVEDQVSKDDKVQNIQAISDSESDTTWEQKIPNDYEEILNLSKDSLRWTTKRELYSILRRGFLINNGQQWFSVDKHGKKCLMLSAKATWVIDDKNSAFESSDESRFGEVLVITAGEKFELVNEIKPEVLSPDTTYASYFVYKLPSEQSKFECPLEVCYRSGEYYYSYIYSYLVSPPNTPVIGQKFDENRYNPLNRHKLSALPRQRSDGWMEVKVWEFQTKTTPETVSMHLKLEHPAKKDLSGLTIHGIEIRPIQILLF